MLVSTVKGEVRSLYYSIPIPIEQIESPHTVFMIQVILGCCMHYHVTPEGGDRAKSSGITGDSVCLNLYQLIPIIAICTCVCWPIEPPINCINDICC